MKGKTTAKENDLTELRKGDCAAIWQEPILEKGNCYRKV